MEVFLAMCRDVHDPAKAGRIRFECPEVLGVGKEHWSGWAMPMMPAGVSSVPYEGEMVWIAFRKGKLTWPVWFGRALAYDGYFGSEEFRDWSSGPYYDTLLDVSEHLPNAYDNLDHTKDPAHMHPPFYDPYVHIVKQRLGASRLINEEPGENEHAMFDRLGQGLRMRGDVAGPKDPHKETQLRGVTGQNFDGMPQSPWLAEQLDHKSVVRRGGWRARAEFRGIKGLSLDLRVRDKTGEEEGIFKADSADEIHKNKVKMSNIDREIQIRRDYGPLFWDVTLQVGGNGGQFYRAMDQLGYVLEMHTSEAKAIWKDPFGNEIKMTPAGMELTSPLRVSITSAATIEQTAPAIVINGYVTGANNLVKLG